VRPLDKERAKQQADSRQTAGRQQADSRQTADRQQAHLAGPDVDAEQKEPEAAVQQAVAVAVVDDKAGLTLYLPRLQSAVYWCWRVTVTVLESNGYGVGE
jgi:hypothetical protein